MGSISKAQAELLASDFLDNLGSDDTLQPKETFTDLVLIAGEMVEDMQDNLNASNSNASGALSSSIEISEPITEGNLFSVNIYMNYYGLFVNSGVKGTKSGSGVYSFKNDLPSKKMVDAIREWIKQGKIKVINTNKKKTISRNEKKNASIGSLDNAYAVARGIKQHGIKATGFLDKAIDNASKKVSERLGLALRADIIKSITETK